MPAPEPTERPFVDRPVDDLEAAEQLAHRAAAEWGTGRVRLLRRGMNAVFAADHVVIRVGRPTAPAITALGLADHLVELGVRVAAPARREVMTEGDLAATAWERLMPSGAPVDWFGVGEMIARLHRAGSEVAPPGYPCPSPDTYPWWHFDEMLADVADLIDGEARSALAAVIERHRWWVGALGDDPVVCHGDLQTDNVVQTADGPAVVDWDLLCRAPVGWDHGPMMTWAERWGGRPGEYEAYAAGYGWSGRDDPFAEAVAELRLVAATLMRVRAGRHDPSASAEAERRLAHWRRDPDAPPWRPQ